MIRAHGGHAECCVDWNIHVYKIGDNCEFKMKSV